MNLKTMNLKSMTSFIYRCSNKPDMYIYLAEEDNFEKVPKEIYNSLGNISFTMELEITPCLKLAKEDAETVMANLKENGFHLQLPSDESLEAIMARISKSHSKSSSS